ncbi:MAG: tetratricopeptide repeat protein [Coleofasciculus sp. D1-CHI-01]|uniref:hypothetical protein n=1 Tax=Coleofasciculus sp. D1-CHI-01 TaxID=3068482 RepID=UPI00330455F6
MQEQLRDVYLTLINASKFFIRIYRQLGNMLVLSSSILTLNAQRNFLKQVLQVTSDSDVDPQAVYPLLQENLALLDENLARVLHEFGRQLADHEAEEAEKLATDIINFSNLLQEFPLGDQAINQEIAITGYQVALTICSRPINSETWALIQNNLGLAYFNRIRGEKTENIENAITSYQAALEIYTREYFPRDWAMNQVCLGLAYSNRIGGEGAENIENAITSYQAALEIYTREAFPVNYTETQLNLGIAYQNAKKLSHAYQAFTAAINIIESQTLEMNVDIIDDIEHPKIAPEWNDVYHKMLELCLMLADHTQSINDIASSSSDFIELLNTRNLLSDGKIQSQPNSQVKQQQQYILMNDFHEVLQIIKLIYK